MLTIGLTGGIGSGKSQVAHFFASWGAAVVDTDVIAHELTAPGGLAIEPIRAAFGTQALAADGSMDRDWMRACVFADPNARHRLEAIIHPLIWDVTKAQALKAQGCYLVVVVPLLLESGRWRDRVDRICVVDCDEATQIARVQKRNGLAVATIERIMAAQAQRQQRLDVADDVVLNDGQTTLPLLEERARAVHQRWCALTARHHDVSDPTVDKKRF
ncbi:MULTISPECIES: dephospho-CoA kinase [Alcaligenes]|jgi:dephospho-CoA kinase|uniref:Dephospho-CoA kinase n=2 Tax=Alcaligenes TaxID=507 RepID=A0A3G2HYH4_9BURK|nr:MULTISPECIES: dephospho-CoA kinase [Alcaligenes]ASR90847.1 dephospho-CoA kinase [Alcaligenes faecalis]AWG37022.1 dephospho-CoA kinase [Alcaligenes aquatilis]AYN22124.1 dephospho-CoA kinase [Alcaligenes aquatilis]MCC9164472.1 dephospho-CoA kinase [Alcaligenes sp. MMA]MCH4223741.1 dephospho-CoA kinase [Alcaligenes faecalis]